MLKALSSLATDKINEMLKRNMRALAFYAAGVLGGLISLFYILNALHAWIAMATGPIGASLIMAALFIILTMTLMLIGHSTRANKKTTSNLTSTALLSAPVLFKIVNNMRFKTTRFKAMAVGGGILSLFVLVRYFRRP
jgi:hypothetical protein